MKNVLFFVATILLFGSLKRGEKPCHPVVVSYYYKKGKLVYKHKADSKGFYLSKINQNYTSLITGKSFSTDSISIKIE